MKTPNKTKPKTQAAVAKNAPAAKAAVATQPKAKNAPVKSTVAKAASKPSAPAKLPAVKAAVKSATKTVSAPKATTAKKAIAAVPSRAAAPQPVKAAPVPKTAQASEAKPMSVTPVESVKSSVEPTSVSTATAPDQLVRATRPSARLAQITVPSLPPAVASTAAKSSFLPSSQPAAVSVPFAPIKKDPKLANNWKSKKVEELLDAEILAMPDDEYMNDMQMAYFRLKLSNLKQDILASAGLTTEHLREDTVVVPDPADRATIEEEHALELRTRDRERKLLKKIEQSIQRIDAGDYGFCDETGEAIGVGRLLARPTATLSLEAQQRRELKQKMFGD